MSDFSGVLAGLSVSPGVTAIIAAGAIAAAPGFARWLTHKVATFFDDTDDWDGSGMTDDDYEPEDLEPTYTCSGCGDETNAYDAVCEYCGHDHDDEGA